MTQVSIRPAPSARAEPARDAARVAAKAGRFALHGLEMCAAMCIGLMALDPIYGWVSAQAAMPNPYLRLPELSVAVVAFNMTLPMVLWMRFRGMDWRLNAEMAAAMVVEAVFILAAYWAGLLPNVPAANVSSLWQAQHALMMPAMLVPMLLRLDHYTGSKHHGHYAAHAGVA